MGMNVGRRKGVVAEMNVVPLIDVLLVLLIIFMVISPLTPKGLEAQIPKQPDESDVPPAPQDLTVVVQVAADGRLRINQEESSWAKLGERIDEIFRKRAQRVAFVQGEEEVLFQDIARAIDIMRTAGVEQVGLLGPDVRRQ